jgi:hypothetical protein
MKPFFYKLWDWYLIQIGRQEPKLTLLQQRQRLLQAQITRVY